MPRTLTIALLATIAVLALADAAGASQRQIQIIQADPPMLSDPVGTLAQFRALGANTVRIIVHWDFIARDTKPADGSDPSSYPEANWAPYDAIVSDARQDGGRLIREPRGSGGFGYDPIFLPDGFDQTTAEMTAEAKDAISHRGRAFRALVPFITAALAQSREGT